MAPTRAEAGGSRWNSFCPPHGLPPAVASDISNFSLSSVQQFLSEFSSLCSALCLSGVGCVGMFSVVRSERGLIYVGAAKLCALDCLFFLNNVFAKHPAGGSLLHRTRLPSSVALSSLPREEGKAGEVQAEAERCTLPQTRLPPCPRLRDALRPVLPAHLDFSQVLGRTRPLSPADAVAVLLFAWKGPPHPHSAWRLSPLPSAVPATSRSCPPPDAHQPRTNAASKLNFLRGRGRAWFSFTL